MNSENTVVVFVKSKYILCVIYFLFFYETGAGIKKPDGWMDEKKWDFERPWLLTGQTLKYSTVMISIVT